MMQLTWKGSSASLSFSSLSVCLSHFLTTVRGGFVPLPQSPHAVKLFKPLTVRLWVFPVCLYPPSDNVEACFGGEARQNWQLRTGRHYSFSLFSCFTECCDEGAGCVTDAFRSGGESLCVVADKIRWLSSSWGSDPINEVTQWDVFSFSVFTVPFSWRVELAISHVPGYDGSFYGHVYVRIPWHWPSELYETSSQMGGMNPCEHCAMRVCW